MPFRRETRGYARTRTLDGSRLQPCFDASVGATEADQGDAQLASVDATDGMKEDFFAHSVGSTHAAKTDASILGLRR